MRGDAEAITKLNRAMAMRAAITDMGRAMKSLISIGENVGTKGVVFTVAALLILLGQKSTPEGASAGRSGPVGEKMKMGVNGQGDLAFTGIPEHAGSDILIIAGAGIWTAGRQFAATGGDHGATGSERRVPEIRRTKAGGREPAFDEPAMKAGVSGDPAELRDAAQRLRDAGIAIGDRGGITPIGPEAGGGFETGCRPDKAVTRPTEEMAAVAAQQELLKPAGSGAALERWRHRNEY